MMAIKGAKVGDYGGRSLATWSSTIIDFNPEVPETIKLTVGEG